MFNEPTVFILWAGASWHYGYPTGEDLVKRVIESSAKAEEYFRHSMHHKYADCPNYVKNKFPSHPSKIGLMKAWEESADECLQLRNNLRDANPPVIDYFLGQSPGLWSIGKLMIAWVILEYETTYISKRKGNVNRTRNLEESPDITDIEKARRIDVTKYNDDWIRFIIYQLASNCNTSNDLLSNDVTFITFNYDISLEYKLYTGLNAIELFNGDPTNHFLSSNRILHVYGKIHDSSDRFGTTRLDVIRKHKDPNLAIKYNNDMYQYNLDYIEFLNDIFACSQNLRVISDHKEFDSKILDTASEAIKRAATIYILGYGFDEKNSERLGLNTLWIGEGHKEFPSRVFFTNFEDRNSVNKKASQLFANNPGEFLPSFIYNPITVYDSLGRPGKGSKYFEKSTRNVYDALERDFDWESYV